MQVGSTSFFRCCLPNNAYRTPRYRRSGYRDFDFDLGIAFEITLDFDFSLGFAFGGVFTFDFAFVFGLGVAFNRDFPGAMRELGLRFAGDGRRDGFGAEVGIADGTRAGTAGGINVVAKPVSGIIDGGSTPTISEPEVSASMLGFSGVGEW